MADAHSDNIDDLKTRFAVAVKDARERHGYTQEVLAGRIDASLDHVSKIERGKYLPGLAVAAHIIRVLAIDANKLLGVQLTVRPVSQHRLEVENELMRSLGGLDDKTLQTAVELVQVLAKRAKPNR